MKVEIQSRKLIKPSATTPPALRHYKIGFIDELAPIFNIPFVLFYTYYHNPKFVVQLQKSLEKTLTYFYPLAGRYIKGIHTVECNDEGAEYVQARVNVTLQEILDPQIDLKLINDFIPSKFGAADEVVDPILSVQVTRFECGGVALGLSISHRIADTSTLSTFLNEWVTLTREETNAEFSGSGFNSFTLFPARNLPNLDFGSPTSRYDDVLNTYVTKKLSFSEGVISSMKAKATHQQSKVQLVLGFIWKAIICVDQAIHGYRRASVLHQTVNLREKTASLLPKDSCGNIWGIISTECGTTEPYEGLADLLTNAVKKAIKDHSKVRHDSNEGQSMILNSLLQVANTSDTVNMVSASSWCKFPLYEADFGFGKPVSISIGSIPMKRVVMLLDDAGGNGVEAYVCMEKEEVPYFEQDENIKAFLA